MEQSQALLMLQEADLTILRVKKKIDSLPQKKAIAENYRKHVAIEEKAGQIKSLIAKYEAEVDKLQNEDSELANSIAKSRETIDNVHDYRLIASLTRDMEGAMKRRDNIEFQLGKLAENLDKAQMLDKQAAKMLAECEARDAELVKSFRDAAAEAQATVEAAKKQREAAVKELDPKLLSQYEDLRKRKDGVGAGKLEDGHCSICRISYQEGQLARLLDGPDITVCPNCHRLIVVRD